MGRSAVADSPSPLRGLLRAQFLGAFEDNAFKLVVALLAVRSLGGDPEPRQIQDRLSLACMVFALPLVLFSVPAALLADRFSKRSTMVALKALEVLIMGSAAALLWWQPGEWRLALIALAAMSMQSALFSPVKAAALPELVAHDRLSAANGSMQWVSFVAIVVGTWAGGALLDAVGDEVWWAVSALAVLSVMGWVAIRSVPPTAIPDASQRQPAARVIAGAWLAFRRERRLWLGTLGLAMAWGTLSLLGQNVLAYASDATVGLGLAERWVGLPLAVCGLGAGLGCAVAGRWSSGKVELGLVPFGALGLSAALAVFSVRMPALPGTLVLTALAGFAAGFILVPLEAVLQWAAPRRQRGAVLALSNAVVFAGMLLGVMAPAWLAVLGLEHQGIFLAGTLLTLGGTVVAVLLLPEALCRAVVVVLTRTVYRLRVVDAQHVPERGPALLVANRVSSVDGMMVMAATDRRVRFLVHQDFFERPIIGRVLRQLRAIPVASGAGSRETLRALRSASEALDQGHVVCIFAEGQITRIGGLLPFRRGLQRIVGCRDLPIVPVSLDRLWGSVFSFSPRRWLGLLPRELPYSMSLAFGSPLPATPSRFCSVVAAVESPKACSCSCLRHLRAAVHPE